MDSRIFSVLFRPNITVMGDLGGGGLVAGDFLNKISYFWDLQTSNKEIVRRVSAE
jgi:hypothetical protein